MALKCTSLAPHGDREAERSALLSVTLTREGESAGKTLMISEIHCHFLRLGTFCFGCCIFFYKVFIFFPKKPLCKKQILILNEIISKNYEDEFYNHL